jgi:hypothetical protein
MRETRISTIANLGCRDFTYISYHVSGEIMHWLINEIYIYVCIIFGSCHLWWHPNFLMCVYKKYLV